jgi:hypothetical protein
MHCTNYYNTLIEIAEDSKNAMGVAPILKGDKKTVAYLQFEMVANNPYKYTSDDVLFSVFAQRKDFASHQLEAEREIYFSKGQPCFRASPLTKSYGWGVHSDPDGKIAIYAVESDKYQQLLKDGTVKKVKAMRSKRK